MVDLRRELSQFNKHFYRLHDIVEEYVVWYQFDVQDSYTDDVYDEGPLRKYKNGVTVPCLGPVNQEDTERLTPDGRKPTNVCQVIIPIAFLRASGINLESDSPTHLNDLFVYGDQCFTVIDYQIEGRMGDDVSVRVRGNQVFPSEELFNELFPPT